LSSERILPGVRALLGRSVRIGSRVPSRRFHWANWLGWRQWLVLFGMGAAVIIIEVRNHTHMWQDHQSGQTVWTDPELIWEIFLFGLVLPILAAVIFGYMGRTAIERDEISRELELRRLLVAQMQEVQSWPELVNLLVTTPGNMVSADRAWLLAQRSDEEEFDQLAHWQRPGDELLPSYPPVNPAVCERCVKATSLRETRISTCQHEDAGSSSSLHYRYCLWLSSERTGKAALLFDMPSEHPLGKGQMKVLDDLGDEMSLAIDNANLQYLKQRQVDVAANERLRIARDLHDTLGQNISYLRLKLEQLNAAGQVPGPFEFQNELAKMLVVAEEAYEQVRDTLEELRTTEHGDLEKTIRLYADKASARTGFSVSIHSSGQPQTLSIRTSRQLMYITREALNNVEKHANAHNVDIHLQWSDGEFKLTIGDDGIGFQPEELNTEDRYGMTIMGERAHAIDANLAIESSPGEGTNLTLTLPLSNKVEVGLKSQ